MNARTLKKKSETDWARIDKMTDDEIDTSDIPPLDDEFFRSAKWQLPRWYFDLGDIKQAQEFAQHIIKRRWQHDKKQTPVASLEHKAFNTSLIVSYARPFHQNRNLKREPPSSLRRQAEKVLSEAELKLHWRVLKLRDTVVAHSAASSLRDPKANYALAIVPIRVTENLSESEVRLLTKITQKWIKYLGVQRANFKRRLAEAIQGSGSKMQSVQNRARSEKVVNTSSDRLREADR